MDFSRFSRFPIQFGQQYFPSLLYVTTKTNIILVNTIRMMISWIEIHCYFEQQHFTTVVNISKKMNMSNWKLCHWKKSLTKVHGHMANGKVQLKLSFNTYFILFSINCHKTPLGKRTVQGFSIISFNVGFSWSGIFNIHWSCQLTCVFKTTLKVVYISFWQGRSCWQLQTVP